jgi:hypothetical protein
LSNVVCVPFQWQLGFDKQWDWYQQHDQIGRDVEGADHDDVVVV